MVDKLSLIMFEMFYFLDICFYDQIAARLERKSFFACTQFLFNLKNLCKKDWERKTD
jgi:hypothetical protein